MYGRIVRTSADEPLRLAENNARRVVMIFGPSALKRIRGKRPFDAMVELGHSPGYIQSEHERGKRFFLVTFARPRDVHAATWRGIINAAALHYPEFASVLREALPSLRSKSLADFEKQAGFSFAEVHAIGPDDPRFYTAERFAASAQTPADVRRFLFNVLHLNELFTGDGYTLRHDGLRGVREYVTANVDIASLNKVKVVPLDW